MRFLVYILLFILGYRILKKFFSPGFGQINRNEEPRVGRNNTVHYETGPDGKSRQIEDVDYEEVD